MKALVTGATGFIGSAIVRQLVEAGHGVRAMVRAASDRRNLLGLPCEIFIGDLREKTTLRQAVDGCEAVFHAAADYRLWVKNRSEMDQVNVVGTRDLFQSAAAAGVRRCVYTSSVATLLPGSAESPADDGSIARESDMIGAYKRSKFLAEQEVKWLVESEGLQVVIVKPTAPFGPGDLKPTPTGRIVIEAASGRMPAFVDTGLNVVHVDDVAKGHLLAWERGIVGESYILGGENRSLRWILETIAAVVGRRAPKVRLPHGLVLPVAVLTEVLARAGVVKHPLLTLDGLRMSQKPMYFSSDRAKRELGYSARPAEAGLRDAVVWYEKNGYLKNAISPAFGEAKIHTTGR